MAVADLPTPWLPGTKLRPPLLRGDLVARGPLLARLAAAVAAYPVTVISAPAGSGKTTLLAQWAQAARGAAGQVAWLSLDEQENDPALFMAALAAALRAVCPGCGGGLGAALAGGEARGDLRPLVAALINDLLAATAGPAALVLDDLHALSDPAIHRALEFLAGRLPPQLRLVILTRADPPIGLARLRARRQLAELRLADLRFSPEDAARLLGGALGAADVAALHRRTEGWAAGLSMAASSLELLGSPDERAALIAALGRSERALFDYLAEEVLGRQDPFARMFLLETAILPELTPAACAAVTGREDAAAVLDDLYRRNLFLVALDEAAAGAAYRYHDLFAAFLRDRLRREHPAWLRELHLRAARATAQPARRVAHLLQADRPEDAAAAVLAAGPGLLAQGAMLTLRQLVEALPHEARAGDPRLTALYARTLHHSWELAAARPWLERAAREAAAAGDGPAAGELLTALADNLRMLGEYGAARAATAAAGARRLPPAADARRLGSVAWQALADGDPAGAAAALAGAIALIEGGAGDALFTFAASYHGPLVLLPGGAALAERFGRLVDASGAPPGGPLQAARCTVGAWAALLRGRWDEAADLAARALALSERHGGLSWVEMDAGAVPWICAGLRGDPAAALRGCEELLARLRPRPSGAGALAWEPLYRGVAARAALLYGDGPVAPPPPVPGEWPCSPALRLTLAAGIAARAGDDDRAAALARELIPAQAAFPVARIAGDARVLLAHLRARAGRPDEALAALGPALAEREREGTPGYLLAEGAAVMAPLLRLAAERGLSPAFAARALALLDAALPAPPAPPQAVAAGLAEPLTPREVEVLRLLAAGASNQAIADALVISLHTVKRHVTNVHQKLGVASRLEAVARARGLGIV